MCASPATGGIDCGGCKGRVFVAGLREGECKPFIVEGYQVGLVKPEVLKMLLNYPEVITRHRLWGLRLATHVVLGRCSAFRPVTSN